MTATQMKRIRSKLAQAAHLTAEAYALANAGHADDDLRYITARASDDMKAAQRRLYARDERFAVNAERIARDLTNTKGDI